MDETNSNATVQRRIHNIFFTIASAKLLKSDETKNVGKYSTERRAFPELLLLLPRRVDDLHRCLCVHHTKNIPIKLRNQDL